MVHEFAAESTARQLSSLLAASASLGEVPLHSAARRLAGPTQRDDEDVNA